MYKSMLAVIIVLLLSGTTFAANTASEIPMPIFFSHLNSPSVNSALSGSCNGDTSSTEIDCYFVQTRIRLKSDPKGLPE